MEIIPPKLTDYQKEIIFSPARFTITEASTKVGKTYSHIVWLFGKAHEYEDAEGKNYWWVAPVYKQANIAYSRLKKYLRGGGYSFNQSKLEIRCPNGALMVFKSADDPDNLYGEDVYACVFDEAPRAKVEAWHALYSTLTATNGKCKLIGNFGGSSNWVHLMKELSTTDPENYAYFRVTCWDAVKAGIITEEVVLQAKRDLPEKIFRSLYLAESMEGEGQLISNENIFNIFENELEPGEQKYITGDIARLGADKTVLMVWDGWAVVEIIVIAQSGIDYVSQRINELMSKYKVPKYNVIVDEDGVGGGVVDFLKCKGFVNNSRPIAKGNTVANFSNLKSQCYYLFAEKVNKRLVKINCKDSLIKSAIIEELEQIRLAKDVDTNKISIKSKDEIKKEIQRSPDYTDSLMMRVYFEIKTTINTIIAV